MDPVTTTIVAALVSGAVAGVSDIASGTVADAYARLKGALLRRGDVQDVVDAVEDEPRASAVQLALAEQVRAIAPDDEVLALAREVLDTVDGLRDDPAAAAVFDFDGLRVAHDMRLSDIEALGTVFRGRSVVVEGDFIAEGIRSGGRPAGK